MVQNLGNMSIAVQLPPNIHNSSLMNHDPYHVPGYGGFCPQYKYQHGETFGRTTSRLLNDGQVASSGRLILANNSPPRSESDESIDSRLEMIRTRTATFNDQKVIPGYSGFVPKYQHYFGKRFAENVNNAFSDFEVDQRAHNKRIAELRLTEALQGGKLERKANDLSLPNITNRYTTPLEAITKEPKGSSISSRSPSSNISPYSMRSDNPDKRFMSGYSGFVPRARGLLGAGYPVLTHQALNEFTSDTERIKAQSAQPIRIQREESPKMMDTKPIYPTESGLIPHYMGHVPEEKFTCGYTFGRSTFASSYRIKNRRSNQTKIAPVARSAELTVFPTKSKLPNIIESKEVRFSAME